MKKIFFILFFFAFALIGKSQNGYVDSLKNVLVNTTDPIKQFETYYILVKKLSSIESGETQKYYLQASRLSAKINSPEIQAKTKFLEAISFFEESDKQKANQLLENVIPLLQKNKLKAEEGDAFSYLGANKLTTGDYIAAIENYQQAIAIATELDNLSEVAENTMYMGRCFEGMGNISKALDSFQKALSLAEQLNKERMITQITLFIGALYSEGVNDKLGLEYMEKAAKNAKETNDTALLLNAYVYIANQHYYKKEYEAALEIYQKIISLSTSTAGDNMYAGTLGNMGNVYADMGKMELAMELQFKALKIFEELGDKQGLTISYSAIGINYLNLKQYDKALEFFNKSLPLAQEMQSWEDMIEIYFNLARLYEEQKNYEKAYENFKLYKQFNDSVFNSDNAQKITEVELNYRFENKQKEALLLQELTNEKFKRTLISAIAGGLILLVIVFLVLRTNRQRKKTNEQLTISNTAIRLQKEELETHKKEITDSINYAKRIQESILPPDSYWHNMLPDSFIFYRPKDIVSGDFYWIEHKNNSVCFAAVDCTGHGVPGALMSVVGFNLLTQAVNEMDLTIPSEILKHLDYGVTKTLRQSGDGKGVKDGMDLSLCSLNKTTNVLQYAGAFNSLYYISGGVFHEIKSDKFPIGVNLDGKVDNYTNHTIPLQKGDCVYLFSDGYADQFGGPKGKKYKYNQLKELLHKIHLLPIADQKEQLANAFDSWKGELEQVDDVVIIGVRI